jgi:hypothetical protein
MLNVIKRLKPVFLLTILFTISSILLCYLLFFQIPQVISGKSLLFSTGIGILSGLGYYLFVKKNICQPKKLITKSLLLYVLLATIISIFIFKDPKSYLIAPSTCLELRVPSAVDNGKPIKIRNINSGFQDISYKQFNRSSSSHLEEDGIGLFPEGNISWCGRVWNKIRIDLTDITNGSKIVIQTTNESKIYYPTSEASHNHAIISIEVPGYFFYNAISQLSAYLAIFIFIFCLALGFFHFDPAKDSIRKLIYIAVCGFFILYSVVSIYLPISPSKALPNSDSGLFLYIGKNILQGNMVYRDIWEHKGPVIYLINAIGLSFGLGTWGVWAIEVLSIFIVLLLIFKYFFKQSGIVSIFCVSLFCGLLVPVLEGGNFTEEYSILFFFLAFYLFHRIENGNTKKEKISLLFIGLVFCLSFLLKATYISIYVSMYLVVFINGIFTKNLKKIWNFLFPITLGFLITFSIFSIYLICNSAFTQFIDNALEFNFIYTSPQKFSILNNVGVGFKYLQIPQGLVYFGLGIIVFSAIIFRNKWGEKRINELWVIAFGFSMELILYNISGKDFPHYAITLVPYITLILGMALILIINPLKEKFSQKTNMALMEKAVSIAFLIIIIPFLIMNLGQTLRSLPPPDEKFLNELDNEIGKNESMLIWGNALYNYLLDIPANSKFVAINGLLDCRYVTNEMVDLYISQISKYRPVLIYPESPYSIIDPLDPTERQNLEMCSRLKPIFDYVDTHYKKEKELSNGQNIWNVYRSIN